MKNRLLLLGAGLGVTLLVALLMLEGVRSFLAYPLTYIAWVATEIYRYTPGWALWGLLLVCMGVVSANSLVRPYSLRRELEDAATHRRQRRVTLLLHWLDKRNHPFYRHHVNHELTELTARILAQRSGVSLQQMRSALRAQQVEMPPELAAYLERGLAMWGDTEDQGWNWFGLRRKAPLPDLHRDDAEILETLAFLEGQMEVDHDPGYFDRS